MKTRREDWHSLSVRTKKNQLKKAVSLIKHLGVELYDYNESGTWGRQILNGLKLIQGRLYVDFETVLLGDLIHEASHILVVDKAIRHEMVGWLYPSKYWHSNDGGEDMAQAASYAICKVLGLDPWFAIYAACTEPLCNEMFESLENGTHEGINLLEQKGICEPNKFPYIFKTFRDFLKEISAQASSIGANSVLIDDWYDNNTKEYSYPKEFILNGERYHWSISSRHTKGRHLTTHYELWGHGKVVGGKRYSTGLLTRAKLFKFFRDIYEKVNQ